MRSKTENALVWMVLVLSASMLLAESQAAIVMVSGVALLNGESIVNAHTVLIGDSLETAPNTALTINTNGSTVLIGASSKVRYLGDSLELQLGSAQIHTSKRLRLETESVRVEPNGTTAKFRVDRAPHTVVIAALEQELRVDNNGEQKVLPPGTTVTLTEKDQNDPASPVRGPSNGRVFIYAAGATVGTSILIWKLDHKKPNVSDQIP